MDSKPSIHSRQFLPQDIMFQTKSAQEGIKLKLQLAGGNADQEDIPLNRVPLRIVQISRELVVVEKQLMI